MITISFVDSILQLLTGLMNENAISILFKIIIIIFVIAICAQSGRLASVGGILLIFNLLAFSGATWANAIVAMLIVIEVKSLIYIAEEMNSKETGWKIFFWLI